MAMRNTGPQTLGARTAAVTARHAHRWKARRRGSTAIIAALAASHPRKAEKAPAGNLRPGSIRPFQFCDLTSMLLDVKIALQVGVPS